MEGQNAIDAARRQDNSAIVELLEKAMEEGTVHPIITAHAIARKDMN